jgi:hypothetical protein
MDVLLDALEPRTIHMAAREHARVERCYGWKDQSRCQAGTPQPLCFACKDACDYKDIVELGTSVSTVVCQIVSANVPKMVKYSQFDFRDHIDR